MIKPVTGRLLALAATNGLVATMMAAAGSHLLVGTMSGAEEKWFDTAVAIQFTSSMALIIAAILTQMGKKRSAKTGAGLVMLGILGFCGSLYVIAIEGAGGPFGISLHWITPLGGMALMAGWGSLAIGAFRSSRGFHG